MKTYIITSYSNFTIIIKAKNKKEALKKAAKIYLVMYEEPATKEAGLEAELLDDYLNEDYLEFILIDK